MLNKTSDGVKMYLDVFITFSLIFREKSIKNSEKKTGKTLICTKNVKNNTSGTHFLAKSRFLMDFRSPSGSPESSKRDEGHWQNPFPRETCGCFVASNAFLSLLAPFWLSSGTSLTPFGHTKNCLLAVLVPSVSSVRRNARSALN